MRHTESKYVYVKQIDSDTDNRKYWWCEYEISLDPKSQTCNIFELFHCKTVLNLNTNSNSHRKWVLEHFSFCFVSHHLQCAFIRVRRCSFRIFFFISIAVNLCKWLSNIITSSDHRVCNITPCKYFYRVLIPGVYMESFSSVY